MTPNGPAAEAGLRSGDVITKLDGKSVLRGRRRRRRRPGRAQSLPGLRLIELAARLEPADTVPVEYRRGKERRTVSVVTEDEPDMFARDRAATSPFTFRGPRAGIGEAGCSLAADLMERLEVAGPHWQFFGGSPLGGLELAPLNPDLGQLLRHRARGSGDQCPQGLGAWASRAGTWSWRWTAGSRPAPPTSCGSCGATMGRKLQAGHPAEPEAGDGDRPARRPRLLTLVPSLCARLTDVRAGRLVYLRPTLEGTMGFLWTLIIGLVVGAIAKLLMPGRIRAASS